MAATSLRKMISVYHHIWGRHIQKRRGTESGAALLKILMKKLHTHHKYSNLLIPTFKIKPTRTMFVHNAEPP